MRKLIFLALFSICAIFSQAQTQYIYNVYDEGYYVKLVDSIHRDSMTYPKNSLSVSLNGGARPQLTLSVVQPYPNSYSALVATWDRTNIYILAPTVDSGFRKLNLIVYNDTIGSAAFLLTNDTVPIGPVATVSYVNGQIVNNPFWRSNSTSLYPTNLGLNVGLGTSTPSSTLQINGNYSVPPFTVGKQGQTMIQTYQPDYSLSFGDLTCDDYGMRYDMSDFGRQFSWSWCGDTAMVLKGSSGQPKYLGIGNTNPSATLDVTGSIWNSPYVSRPPSMVTNSFGYTWGTANEYGFLGLDSFGNVSLQSNYSGLYIFANSRNLIANVDTISVPDQYGGTSIGWVETDIDGHGHMQRSPLPSTSDTTPSWDATLQKNQVTSTTPVISSDNNYFVVTSQTAYSGNTQINIGLTSGIASILFYDTSGYCTTIQGARVGDQSILNIPYIPSMSSATFAVSVNGIQADSTGNVAFVTPHNIINTTPGSTINIADNAYNFVKSSTTGGTITISLPASPSDGDFVEIKFLYDCSLSYSSATIQLPVTGVTAGQIIKYVYDAATTTWY